MEMLLRIVTCALDMPTKPAANDRAITSDLIFMICLLEYEVGRIGGNPRFGSGLRATTRSAFND